LGSKIEFKSLKWISKPESDCTQNEKISVIAAVETKEFRYLEEKVHQKDKE
jgi:hypothetical protein